MNTHLLNFKRNTSTIKTISVALVLIIATCISIQTTVGQVVATYEDEILTLENFNKRPIIIFKNNIIKNDLVKTNSFLFVPKEMNIEPCGINLLRNFEILRGVKIFHGVKESPKKIVYYFYEGDSPMKITSNDRREIVVSSKQKREIPETKEPAVITPQIIEEPTPTPQTPQETPAITEPVETKEVQNVEKQTLPKEKPNNKPEPKKEKVKIIINPYTDIVNAFLEKNNKALQIKELNNEEREHLKKLKLETANLKKEIENYIETLWEKNQDTKSKCEDCEVLLKSSNNLCRSLDKLSSKIVNLLKKVSDNVVIGWREQFWKLVLEPTVNEDSIAIVNIQKDIDRRTQHNLLGWIGVKKVKEKLLEVERNYNNIIETSNTFIAEKKKEYADENDKAVIEDLVNDIPVFYKEIPFCKNSLEQINIPYLNIILTGFILLLLIIGSAFYIITFIRNTIIKRRNKKKITQGRSGLLIEDDDIVEEKSYLVNISDIKEKAGTEYYEVKMSTIFNDTTIETVYFSKKAIFDIYKFFSGFLKHNDKTNETGCFLLGRWDYAGTPYQQLYDISIESIVEPGDDAIYGEYNLNFGAKIGITLNYAIENLCEKTSKEYVHTAWMHSHPGLGLFLSSQDLNVQSQLAHSQHRGRLLAIVLDSNTPDFKMAFFTPKKDGSMNNDKDLKLKLSLEAMYQWAKSSSTSTTTEGPIKDKQNRYSIDLQNNIDNVKKVSFHGSVIIDMDMAVMPDRKGLSGYFTGEKHENEFIINNFIDIPDTCNEPNTPHLENRESKPIACFLVETNLESITQYASQFPHFELYVVYSFDDEKIFLLSKNELKNFPASIENTTSVSLMKMKEWTRRIR